jgi:hypothetical protein
VKTLIMLVLTAPLAIAAVRFAGQNLGRATLCGRTGSQMERSGPGSRATKTKGGKAFTDAFFIPAGY